MKKSNIILISLFIITLTTIVIVHLKVKSTITNIQEFEYQYNPFNKLVIENGWIVELQKDSVTNVTINIDTIKKMIAQDGNTFILKENTDKRKSIHITNPCTKEISMFGNSTLRYYAESSTDSLMIRLSETSDIIIHSEKAQKGKTKKTEKNTIDFLRIEAKHNSRLNIYTHVNTLEGFMADTSFLYINGRFRIKNMEKSENARINSW